MDYDILVQQIMNCAPLYEKVKAISKDGLTLNLVSKEWKAILETSELYKRHVEKKVKFTKGHECSDQKAHIRNIMNPRDQFNITVAGKWYLSKIKDETLTVVCQQSEPLTLIGKSMLESFDQKLHDGGRYFFSLCNPSYCSWCKEAHKQYNVPFSKQNTCIYSTFIFDGIDIKNEFALTLQENLLRMGSFMAVFNILIKSRTTFGEDSCKMGGEIHDMIIFQEASIKPKRAINLNLSVSSIRPHIEYPEENETDVESKMLLQD